MLHAHNKRLTKAHRKRAAKLKFEISMNCALKIAEVDVLAEENAANKCIVIFFFNIHAINGFSLAI